MSDENHPVLSSEEVDAILKVTEDTHQTDLSHEIPDSEKEMPINPAVLANIAEIAAADCEKSLISFLRKKIQVKVKSFELTQIGTVINQEPEKHILSIYRFVPNQHYGIFVLELSMLHQAINLLYGGQLDGQEKIIEKPGKVGKIIAEKIASICIASFVVGSQEYGNLSYEMLKTITNLTLPPKLTMDDKVYSLELTFKLAEIDMTLRLLIPETGIRELFIVTPKSDVKHREKDFWRTAIKSQVVDSMVNVSVTLPDVSIKVSELMNLKPGDVITISDPTLVYVCLNNLKLFRAKAGKSNSKRVVKIVAQI